MPPDFQNGRVQQWTFNVQQRLTSSMLLDVAYVGNHDSHLALLTVINNRPPGPGPTTTNKPYPAYAGISFIRAIGEANYNGLQVKLEKRYSSGLQFISSYTYSKCMDNGPGTNVGEGGVFARMQSTICEGLAGRARRMPAAIFVERDLRAAVRKGPALPLPDLAGWRTPFSADGNSTGS